MAGANHYFLLDNAEVARFGLPPEVLIRAVERPRDVRGLEVRPDEERWLFRPSTDVVKADAVAAYLRRGVDMGIPDRYKPRMRKDWATVPLPRARADAFLPYMSQRGPRLIGNPSGAVSSNLLHGVTFHDQSTEARVVAASMLSAATRLSAEIEGRAYGGGVLKLETKEAERMAVPVAGSSETDRLRDSFEDLDVLVREGRIEDASSMVDSILALDHQTLTRAADIYRDRRLTRGMRRARAR